jgi:hypothetical protein
MFAFVANAGLISFLIVSLFVGVRLLLLARCTRGFPELLIGTDCNGVGLRAEPPPV